MSTTDKRPVLILDGDTLPALAITRSLGKKGVHVTIASHTHKPISGYSKYTSSSLQYPDPLNQTKAFLRWIDTQISISGDQLIIPVTERTLVPISTHLDNLASASNVCMASASALETALDKSKTAELAKELEIPQPNSWLIETTSDLARCKNNITYPVVIKPGRSIANTAERLPLAVTYAHSEEQLEKICCELLGHVHLILQSYFTGKGEGIELIARHGEILYAFQHQRLHEMPLSGGGSSYRESVLVDSQLLEASKKLVRALHWHGVAMIEFKKNHQTGEFILIEINGRFWGSLPLAIAAGADFPYMLYQLYADNSKPIDTDYKIGIKCRKLSSDISWLEAVLRKDADQRLVSIPSISSALRDMLDIFLPGHHFDAQSINDIKPGLVELRNIFFSYWKRITDLYSERKKRKRGLKQSHYSHIQKQLQTANNILYICYGNINRSAVAHILADSMFNSASGVHFKSAGFHPVAGRAADNRMVSIAAKNSISMAGFQSTVVTQDLIDWADIIFVMDVPQIEKITSINKTKSTRTFLLGGLTNTRKAIEIHDPYNKAPDDYLEAFQNIHKAIEQLKIIKLSKG